MSSPFRWAGPDGSEVMAFISRGYCQLRELVGDPPTLSACMTGFLGLIRLFERPDYMPSDLPLFGTVGDNEDIGEGEVGLASEWNAEFEWPRLRYSTIAEYFAALRPIAERLPLIVGDGGSYWEDGVGAHARAVSSYREAQVLVPAAEGLAGLLAAADLRRQAPVEVLDRLWEHLLIGCEHTWGSSHSGERPRSAQQVDQLDWKEAQIRSAWRAAWDELRRGLSALAAWARCPPGSVLVYNPLSWDRDGEVEVEVPAGRTLLDEDGHPLPYDVLGTEAGLDRVRCLVGGVPGLGYRALGIGPPDPKPPPRAAPSERAVSTERYDVRLEGGRVTGLLHRPSGRELLDAESRCSLGELLYVEVREGGWSRLNAPVSFLAPPALNVSRAATSVASVRRCCDGLVISLQGSAPTVPELSLDLRLRDSTDFVDLVVHLVKTECRTTESLYVAFPFAGKRPVVRYDRQLGWVRPDRDHQPGACNDWFTVAYTVGTESGAGAVIWSSLDAPLFTLDDVAHGAWSERCDPLSGTILSWVMNNHWNINYARSQAGPMSFRYRFSPAGSFDPAAAARFGREARHPLLASEVTWMDWAVPEAPRLPGPGRLLEVDAPANVVVTPAAARLGDGLLLRIVELAGSSARVRVKSPYGPRGSCHACGATEEDGVALEISDDAWVEVEVPASSLVTLRLTGGPARGGL